MVLKKDLVCPPSHVISGHKKSNQENAFEINLIFLQLIKGVFWFLPIVVHIINLQDKTRIEKS
jgi:hypothetical protein